MATTDARPGFKLPWSADRNESDSSASDSAQPDGAATPAEPGGNGTAPANDPWGFGRSPVATQVTEPAAVAADPATNAGPWGPPAEAAPVAPRRKPNKLMADLTRAMQTAAEAARSETLARLQTDAKAFVEEIHAKSGTEATELRSRAEEDIAGIRDWSKAEIARIREETDRRITERKANLETEVEAHAARIEARIERVQAHVGRFEAEMAGFFEKLLAEDDPTHLAAMAENLPEPPSFEDDLVDDETPFVPATTATAVAEAAPEPVETVDATVEVDADPEAAFAAIQAAAEAAVEAPELETPADDLAAESVNAPDAPAPVEVLEADPADEADQADPRIAALGLSPEAAAEAEAEAELDVTGDSEEIATFSDDALAARLAGLVPDEGDGSAPRHETHTTRVVVTGLISVASIAGFKRQLGRLPGVESVGVSSGPEGEFVFAVAHATDVRLADAVPTLTDFAAQVTDTADDTVSVAARDPETTA